jgi:hypothetical protein
MRSPLKAGAVGGLLLMVALSACNGGESNVSPTTGQGPDTGAGTLTVRANGEDFVLKGLTTKDGWILDFDHVYLSFGEVKAYQMESAFDPASDGAMPEAIVKTAIPGTTVVDLTAIGNGEQTVLVGEVTAPAGQFNALSWQMPPATTGPAQGYSILIKGTASKDKETIAFRVGVQEPLGFVCGDFVGDGRKGILAPGGTADLEATFHLDHLFGEGGKSADDDINRESLGFAPLAALAQNNSVDVSSQDLKEKLSEADYQRFLQILSNLGHVGEGHCREVNLT